MNLSQWHRFLSKIVHIANGYDIWDDVSFWFSSLYLYAFDRTSSLTFFLSLSSIVHRLSVSVVSAHRKMNEISHLRLVKQPKRTLTLNSFLWWVANFGSFCTSARSEINEKIYMSQSNQFSKLFADLCITDKIFEKRNVISTPLSNTRTTHKLSLSLKMFHTMSQKIRRFDSIRNNWYDKNAQKIVSTANKKFHTQKLACTTFRIHSFEKKKTCCKDSPTNSNRVNRNLCENARSRISYNFELRSTQKQPAFVNVVRITSNSTLFLFLRTKKTPFKITCTFFLWWNKISLIVIKICSFHDEKYRKKWLIFFFWKYFKFFLHFILKKYT